MKNTRSIFRSLNDELLEFTRARTDVDGAELTTFALGGKIACLVEPRSPLELARVLRLLSGHSAPHRVLGAGSNIVIDDGGIQELVVRLGKELGTVVFTDGTTLSLEELELLCRGERLPMSSKVYVAESHPTILTFAACPLMSLSRKLSQAGLSGLEFAAGIPASLGGAVAMNAGAHGGSMSDVVHRVYLLNSAGELEVLGKRDLQFGYRQASIPGIVLAAELRLQPADTGEILARRAEFLDYRKRTQPLILPSAGSVFRNPHTPEKKLYAAQLLEAVGLKGFQSGGVGFSSMHANWLVKLSADAQAANVFDLVNLARLKVFDSFQIELKPEIIYWRDDGHLGSAFVDKPV